METNEYIDRLYKSRSYYINKAMEYSDRKAYYEKKLENCHPMLVGYITNMISHCEKMIAYCRKNSERHARLERDWRFFRYQRNLKTV